MYIIDVFSSAEEDELPTFVGMVLAVVVFVVIVTIALLS
jgi:hypothetical protein